MKRFIPRWIARWFAPTGAMSNTAMSAQSSIGADIAVFDIAPVGANQRAIQRGMNLFIVTPDQIGRAHV